MALSADFPESFLMITFFHRPTKKMQKETFIETQFAAL